MANTYTQLHIHLIFAVKYRAALIKKEWKERLHQYVTGIVQRKGHKMLQVNSMPDHIHLLIGLRPSEALSSLVQIVKSESTKWIRENDLSHQFSWQEGYGAFSCSKNHVENVIRYIMNQDAHHKKQNFRQEYLQLLSEAGIKFEPIYLFSEPG